MQPAGQRRSKVSMSWTEQVGVGFLGESVYLCILFVSSWSGLSLLN